MDKKSRCEREDADLQEGCQGDVKSQVLETVTEKKILLNKSFFDTPL